MGVNQTDKIRAKYELKDWQGEGAKLCSKGSKRLEWRLPEKWLIKCLRLAEDLSQTC